MCLKNPNIKYYFVLFFLLLLSSLSLRATDPSRDFWEEERLFWEQAESWEIPTEDIIEWINDMEKLEKESIESKNDLKIAQEDLKSLQKDFENTQNLLIGSTIISVVLAVFVIVK